MQSNEVYFKDIRNKIIEQIEFADSEILIAVAWFTDEKIIETLLKCSKRGISISIIFYDDKINSKDLFKDLYYISADIRVSKKLMHNKFCVIDNSTIINGSYNWTYNASSNNENIQITTNNENLARSFSAEFYTLQQNCLKIDEHFKYAVGKVNEQEKQFQDYFETVEQRYKFPYFYKLINFAPNKRHFNPKIKDGFYLINDYNDECNFYRYKYYLERDFNLSQIQKVSSIEFCEPKYFENIIQFENLNSQVFPVEAKKYIVEQSLKNYNGPAKDVYLVDNLGNVLVNKIRYAEKFSNGFYMVQYRHYSTEILDNNLNKINLAGHFVELIDGIGIITSLKQRNFGLYDFNGKILVENKYDYYKRNKMSPGKIEFREFPFAMSNYSDYSKNIVINTLHYDYNNSAREKSTFKTHLYNVYTGKFTILPKIGNNNINTEYFFLSDENYKYKDFYTICACNGVVLEAFKNMKTQFSGRFLKENEKQSYAEKLLKSYHYKVDAAERQKKVQSEKFCYIATLAYQNIDHPQVEYLRHFRDNRLRKIYLGKGFIKLYYKFSPRLVVLLGNKTFTNYFLRMFIDLLIKILKLTHLLSSKK